MSSISADAKVVTVELELADLNSNLAGKIFDDCGCADGSSWDLTTAEGIPERSDLTNEEVCVVVAVPGVACA
ncbi:hypothetical protein HDG40_000782 [Paraburkholderia sp. JPY158]|uniref:Uncharacterized protein n=1 Tax=Paraburkholderia atlantica TaxID=2654982 RepID=A0A7W8Q2T2_PARAM|nr:hypothetical protein [Paraburkholderia atlantica]